MAGYTKLAHFMAERSHKIVRRYDQLAVRDLLYLQAELCHLEIEYALVAKRDASEQDERQYYNREWWHLQASKSRGLDGKQWEIATEIRAKLREYCEPSCITVTDLVLQVITELGLRTTSQMPSCCSIRRSQRYLSQKSWSVVCYTPGLTAQLQVVAVVFLVEI